MPRCGFFTVSVSSHFFNYIPFIFYQLTWTYNLTPIVSSSSNRLILDDDGSPAVLSTPRSPWYSRTLLRPSLSLPYHSPCSPSSPRRAAQALAIVVTARADTTSKYAFVRCMEKEARSWDLMPCDHSREMRTRKVTCGGLVHPHINGDLALHERGSRWRSMKNQIIN